MYEGGNVQEEQSLQLQEDESSWIMTLARKVLGMVVGKSYTGPLSAVNLIVGEIGDCWAVFLVTIVLSSFAFIPAFLLAS